MIELVSIIMFRWQFSL